MDGRTQSWSIKLKQMRDQGAKHQIEEAGAKLRSMMPWIASNKLLRMYKNLSDKVLIFDIREMENNLLEPL